MPPATTTSCGRPESSFCRFLALGNSGYVNASPLIETQRVVEAFLPDEPLPELDGAGSHKSTQELEISDVACLVEPDIGLGPGNTTSARRT